MRKESEEDSLRAMQLLRDNFTLWEIDKKIDNRDEVLGTVDGQQVDGKEREIERRRLIMVERE